MENDIKKDTYAYNMGGDDDLRSRILDCLEEKPRSISEIARELDEEKYEISKKIEVLEERGDIDTYRIGRSTACILADQHDDTEDTGPQDAGAESVADGPGAGAPDPTQNVRGERTSAVSGDTREDEQADPGPDGPDGPGNSGPEPPWDQDPEDWFNEDPPEKNPFRDDAGSRDGRDAQQDSDRSRSQKNGVHRQQAGTDTDAGGTDVWNARDVQRTQNARDMRNVQDGLKEGMKGMNGVDTAVQNGAPAMSGSGTGNGPRTIGIVSGKGGVGKTVVTLNLGAAMMDLGENVIVIDSDAEMPNVGLHLGMYTPPTSLQQVVEQDMHIMSAMHVDKDSGLRVIPTALGRESVQAHVDTAIDMLPDEYHVLIDSPPGMERPVQRVIETCDDLIFVTVPEIPAVTDTYKLYQEAQDRGKNVLGCVVNMYSSPKKHLSVAEVEKTLEMPVMGVIEHSKLIKQSIFDTQPAVSMNPHAKPSRAFKEIAADVTGNRYDPSLLDRVRGLLP